MTRSLCSAALAAALTATAATSALAQPSNDVRATPGPKHELPLLFVRAPNEVSGTIRAVDGNVITVETRKGETVRVDASQALARQQSTLLLVGRPVNVRGTYDANRVMHAQAIVRTKPSPAVWRLDR